MDDPGFKGFGISGSLEGNTDDTGDGLSIS